MPTEEMYVYSAADFGLASVYDFFFGPTIATIVSGPDLLTLTDDDPDFDAESTGTSQLLDGPMVLGNRGEHGRFGSECRPIGGNQLYHWRNRACDRGAN